jgi:hypothetical protein
MGLRKKPRFWGTVYDSETKQPIGQAIVKLFHAKTAERAEQAITDEAGRFGFLATSGEFTITASKERYVFPSIKVSEKSDGLYENIYHGEVLSFSSSSTLVVPNIPMDFESEQEVKKLFFYSANRLRYLIEIILTTMFVAGVSFSIYSFVFNPNLRNNFLFFVNFAFLLLGLYRSKQHLWGSVTKNGKPVSQIKFDLTNPDLENFVLERAISAPDGKFFLKAPNPGKYKVIARDANNNVLFKEDVKIGKEGVFNGEIKL